MVYSIVDEEEVYGQIYLSKYGITEMVRINKKGVVAIITGQNIFLIKVAPSSENKLYSRLQILSEHRLSFIIFQLFPLQH